jgi:5-dehydro-4-deoxyglucarate dehydratase
MAGGPGGRPLPLPRPPGRRPARGPADRRHALLEGFYAPLVRLRDQTTGFGVSLIKAGLRLGGLPVGPVRAPLVDPTEEQLVQLKSILAKGYELAGR